METAFLLVYSSFLPDASSMSLLMFYRLASYYAVFAASAGRLWAGAEKIIS